MRCFTTGQSEFHPPNMTKNHVMRELSVSPLAQQGSYPPAYEDDDRRRAVNASSPTLISSHVPGSGIGGALMAMEPL